MYPTAKQEAKCFILCQRITAMFLPIWIVRLDERNGEIFILAGEEMAIVINPDGEWEFDNEA
ncbi:DUF6888 family protein [Myxacorys almedinensis]|uniref:DUF6888 domain-containing protein n=1 Tax=Myxacorys almedinensis A TaxID=2690445 RepID=A0A8J8CHZ3_9CYAN|nr:hypothetical protein [Myxacorys almedinensis A]